LPLVVIGIGPLIAGYGIVAALISWIVYGFALTALSLVATKPLFLRNKSLGMDYAMTIYWLSTVEASAVAYLSGTVDLFVLVLLGPHEEAGIFRAANEALTFLPLLILTPLASTLLPAMSSVFGSRGHTSPGLARSSRIFALSYVPAAFGLAATAQPTVKVLVGASYVEASLPLALMAVGSIAIGFVTPILATLQAGGMGSRYFFVNLIGAVAFVPIWGIMGAVAARELFFAVILIGSRLAIRGPVGFSVDLEALSKALVGGAFMCLAMLLVGFLRPPSPMLLVIMVGGGLSTYALSLRLLKAIRTDDIVLVRKSLPGRFSSVASSFVGSIASSRTVDRDAKALAGSNEGLRA